MNIYTVRDVFTSQCSYVYHFRAPVDASVNYILWAETGISEVMSADNVHTEQVVSGEAYYYTNTEYDSRVDSICNALDSAGVGYHLGAIGYDDTTGQIIHQFTWEVPIGKGKLYTD